MLRPGSKRYKKRREKQRTLRQEERRTESYRSEERNRTRRRAMRDSIDFVKLTLVGLVGGTCFYAVVRGICKLFGIN